MVYEICYIRVFLDDQENRMALTIQRRFLPPGGNILIVMEAAPNSPWSAAFRSVFPGPVFSCPALWFLITLPSMDPFAKAHHEAR